MTNGKTQWNINPKTRDCSLITMGNSIYQALYRRVLFYRRVLSNERKICIFLHGRYLSTWNFAFNRHLATLSIQGPIWRRLNSRHEGWSLNPDNDIKNNNAIILCAWGCQQRPKNVCIINAWSSLTYLVFVQAPVPGEQFVSHVPKWSSFRYSVQVKRVKTPIVDSLKESESNGLELWYLS